MPVAVVAFYAGLNGLIAMTLVLMVMRQRQRTKTGFGTGGHLSLEQAIRVHGNFVEYVPLILLLMLMLALTGLGALWLHLMGIALTIGRVLHAWGLSRSAGESFGRAAGTGLTWLVLIAAALLAIWKGLAAL